MWQGTRTLLSGKCWTWTPHLFGETKFLASFCRYVFQISFFETNDYGGAIEFHFRQSWANRQIWRVETSRLDIHDNCKLGRKTILFEQSEFGGVSKKYVFIFDLHFSWSSSRIARLSFKSASWISSDQKGFQLHRRNLHFNFSKNQKWTYNLD